jgi:hypothetical protein
MPGPIKAKNGVEKICPMGRCNQFPSYPKEAPYIVAKSNLDIEKKSPDNK